jgi:alpha-D-ribose 1-methylphosphonate 5-triphosphate synthase subunit PhnL
MRSDWGFVHQNTRDGLRMGASAGGNIGERLMAIRARHNANSCAEAAAWLACVEIDMARLHHLPPATFSGGEQQRVSLARGFAPDYPVVVLDEPTASLDAAKREVVIALIAGAKARGAAVTGIVHHAEVRDRVADRLFDVSPLPEVA